MSDRGSKRKAESEIAPTSDPKEAVCFYCNTKGHWKRSCPKYLKDLKDEKVEKGSHPASPCKGIYETVECISHNGNKHIAQLQKDGVLESFDFKSDDVYESCLLGKMTKSPFTRSCERGEGLLDLVHTDVCGPFRSATKDRKRYYVTFTDDFSRYGYVYLIKHKLDTFEVFKSYPEESFRFLFYKPKDNVVFVARRGVFLEREMISKEDSRKQVVESASLLSSTMVSILKRIISDSTLSELDEPANYKEAMVSPKAAKWKEPIKSKIQSMYDNQV
ncbi:retrotransposon protein, putative, ty1-copia subclass [Tanacetum coccineum]